MILSENEANEKWCPFSRVAPGGENRTNYEGEDLSGSFKKLPGSRCISAECMAWIWINEQLTGIQNPHGYCGLTKGYHR